jgi:excisionase family DNA binding protein
MNNESVSQYKTTITAINAMLSMLSNPLREKAIREISQSLTVVAVRSNRDPHHSSLLMTQAEAGRLLGCSRHTIKRLVADGLLHTTKLRGAIRYRRSEVSGIAGV